MTWEYFGGLAVALFLFFSLSLIWGAMAAPLLFFFALFLAPIFIILSVILGPLAIVAAWMYEEHEILGTEPDAVPG